MTTRQAVKAAASAIRGKGFRDNCLTHHVIMKTKQGHVCEMHNTMVRT